MKLFYTISFLVLLQVSVRSQERVLSAGFQDPATQKHLKFYPNPAITYINFELISGDGKEMNFQVYNFIGKKVFEQTSINAKVTVNLNDYLRGVYIYQLRDKSGKLIDSGKFQVTK
jgi:hypothetical protein